MDPNVWLQVGERLIECDKTRYNSYLCHVLQNIAGHGDDSYYDFFCETFGYYHSKHIVNLEWEQHWWEGNHTVLEPRLMACAFLYVWAKELNDASK